MASEQSPSTPKRFHWFFFLLLAAGSAVALFARFRAGEGMLAFFEDDFFYYLRVAQNIAAGHGSTYDGTHLTNGYHPLWMLVLVGLSKATHGKAFFLALTGVLWTAVMATYLFLRAAFARLASTETAEFLAAWFALGTLIMTAGGMEVTLSLPLVAALCWYRLCRYRGRAADAFALGLLSSLVILARLDGVLLVILFAAFEAFRARPLRASQVRNAVAYCAGLLPVVGYLAYNVAVFGTATPVSGQAKQLRWSHVPSLRPFNILHAANAPLWLFVMLPFYLGMGWTVLAFLRGRAPRKPRAITLALLCFPFLQFAALSLLSDWPLWVWYLYTFVAALFGLAFFWLPELDSALRARPWLRAQPVLAGILALLVAVPVEWQLRRTTHLELPFAEMYQGARELRTFAATHPGVYAMGDRAGFPGYMLHVPMIQTEGLVMDEAFLEHLRRQEDLRAVLRAYHVRYYIATDPTHFNGCLRAREPYNAGPTSYVMYGVFCSQPLQHYTHGEFNTYIFDMNNEAP